MSGDAPHVIDARGLVVAPGFIDMHAHADLALIVDPARQSAISQGVTTEVIGQDGLSYAPVEPAMVDDLHGRIRGWNGDLPEGGVTWGSVADYLDRLEGAALNAAYLVPHGTLRLLVMGTEPRQAAPAELDRMVDLLDASLSEGAVGMSTGLTYAPAMFADDEELVRLCDVVASHGGYYAPHHRSYGAGAIEAYAACLDIARRTGVALHLTHAHVSFEINRGRAGDLLAIVDAARADGLDVTLDSYPYSVGSSYLHAFLPGGLQRLDVDEILDRLTTPSVREALQVALEERGTVGSHGMPVDWTRVVVGSSSEPDVAGHSIAEIAADRGAAPIDTYCDLLVAERLGAMCTVHEGHDANVREIMQHPAHMVGSDGLLTGQRPHPRAFGTFARYLGTYTRDEGLFSLEQMVHKMTGAPARRIGFTDRGQLRSGMAADIVCFDPTTVRDRATFEHPKLHAEGVRHVFVNGIGVLVNGRRTAARPGRALRKQRVEDVGGIRH